MSNAELQNSLPGEFAFYHLGTVRPETSVASAFPTNLEALGLKAVAFSIYGEARGVAVAIFARDTDESMFIELGNTLASRFADALAAGRGIVMVSPAVPLSTSQYGSLLSQAAPVTRRYEIAQGEIWLAVFPSPSLKEEWSA